MSGLDHDGARHAFIESMVRFARQIGSRLIAEGIETEGELAALATLGVVGPGRATPPRARRGRDGRLLRLRGLPSVQRPRRLRLRRRGAQGDRSLPRRCDRGGARRRGRPPGSGRLRPAGPTTRVLRAA
ncbi:MAG: EAL domain-containing protein [Euzebyales bacterium]|nr:EAL domain-containing protein [Euzebyales bacterium]